MNKGSDAGLRAANIRIRHWLEGPYMEDGDPAWEWLMSYGGSITVGDIRALVHACDARALTKVEDTE